MSTKQPALNSSTGGKARVPPTMHGRPPIVVDEPFGSRSSHHTNEGYEQDEEMNAHLSEKFRKGTYKTPKCWEQQGESERALPPHPLLRK